jgi:hypothetical protein
MKKAYLGGDILEGCQLSCLRLNGRRSDTNRRPVGNEQVSNDQHQPGSHGDDEVMCPLPYHHPTAFKLGLTRSEAMCSREAKLGHQLAIITRHVRHSLAPRIFTL